MSAEGSPVELVDRVVRRFAEHPAVGPVTGSVSDGGAHGRATVDLPAERWPAAVQVARDEFGCDFFDWLSAVDQGDDGFDVICHLWSTAGRFGLLLRTRLSRGAPALPSIVELYPGAAWPEREAHEMFGLDFPGHPALAPLLLAPQFEGHPLRKDFVLASRVVRPWPGSHPASAQPSGRAPIRPLGVPADAVLARPAAPEPPPAPPAGGAEREQA